MKIIEEYVAEVTKENGRTIWKMIKSPIKKDIGKSVCSGVPFPIDLQKYPIGSRFTSKIEIPNIKF